MELDAAQLDRWAVPRLLPAEFGCASWVQHFWERCPRQRLPFATPGPYGPDGLALFASRALVRTVFAEVVALHLLETLGVDSTHF